jgi:YidC/Oxa1 family membrane protein insertase
MQDDNRNLLIFFAVVMVLLLVYQHFVIDPITKRRQAEQAQATAAASVAPAGQAAATALTRVQALALSPRIAIQTPQLTGSVSLEGARIDDLYLAQYRQTTDKSSPPVELLRPQGADDAYFAVSGWTGANLPGLPDERTPWTADSQGPLAPGHPLDLTYSSPGGLVFHRRIEVDPDYLFTVTDEVENRGATPVSLAPYGSVQRRGLPEGLGKVNIVHEGAIGMFDRNLKEVKYAKWKKDGEDDYPSTGGWLGVTDKYWMTVFIPNQAEPLRAQFRVKPVGGVDTYETAFVGQPRIVAPGGRTTEVTHLFAGAKTVAALRGYGDKLGAPNFDKAVDWGFLEVLTKPLFNLLDYYANHLTNFGVAILALTVTIRVLLFPIFNASYAMSTKMKKVQPQMQALQAKFKDDQQALQKEMMALYQREKINPVTGCIPMLMPIPVFYALTKIFTVTIEMRQAPFLWIKDLSAPDPTTIWNLFGLLPYDPFASGVVQGAMHLPFVGTIVSLILHLGAWPIAYGATMWLTQLTGPPMTGVDPMQQKMLRWMPWIFMLFLAQYTVGLVIYWSFSSIFTIVQQYVLMRRFKVDNPIDSFLARLTTRKATG